MKYYKDIKGTVYAYSVTQTPKKDLIKMTRVEIDQHLEPKGITKSYAENRKEAYPPIGDQLDAILKQFNLMRLNGIDMNETMDSILAQWLSVKKKFPKRK